MSQPFTEQLTQSLAIMGRIPPTNHTTNTDTTVAGIDMSVIRRLLTVVNIGVLGTNSNIQIYYQASATANMASPTNVASAIPITGSTANRIETLEVRADQLPANTRYVQPVIIVNANSSFLSVECFGGCSAYSPANQFNLANTVDQAVVT